MKIINESIFSSAVRSFVKAFFGIAGIGIALFSLMLIIGILDEGNITILTTASPVILPDASGMRTVHPSKAPVVLHINITGVVGVENLTEEKIRRQLLEAQEGSYKGRVKALMLTINTPGGSVKDSNGIYSALKEYKERHDIPVYAFVNDMCASGGMYIAAAADKIYATDTSVIGSIGVIFSPFFNVTKLMEKVGVEAKTLFAGKEKEAMTPLRPWRDNEESNYQHLIDSFYAQFVSLITSERPLVNRKKLIEEYGARVFPADEAKKIGYIDEAGASYLTTLTALAEKAELKRDSYQVIELQSRNFIEEMFNAKSPLFSGTIEHSFSITPTMKTELMGKPLYLYSPLALR